jgi:AmiR/NasT family two-component response regulator
VQNDGALSDHDRLSDADLRAALQEAREQNRHLTEALRTNRQIGMAIGIVMATEKLTEEQAFRRLTQVSQRANRKLRDLAEEVVYSGLVPGEGSRPV